MSKKVPVLPPCQSCLIFKRGFITKQDGGKESILKEDNGVYECRNTGQERKDIKQ